MGEKALDLVSAQWAAVTKLARLGVLDGLANSGGGGEIEFGGFDGGGLVEEGQDDVVLGLGHGTGGQVADQTAVALSGFRLSDGGESEVVIERGRPPEAASGDGVGSQTGDGQAFEGDSTTEEGSTGGGEEEGGSRAGSQSSSGDSKTGSGTDGADSAENGAGAAHGASTESQTEVGLGHHDDFVVW